MINYACIKNNIVENVLLFEENNPELLQQVKETFSYDELIEKPLDLVVNVGHLYDGTYFYVLEGVKTLYLDGCEHGATEHGEPEHEGPSYGDPEQINPHA